MDNNTTSEVIIAGIDLRQLLLDGLRIMRRTLAAFAVLTLLCAAVLCWQTRRSYRPMYRASATFTVYVTNPLQSEIRSYNTATAEQMAKTFPYILTSGALSDRVRQALDIAAMPAVSATVLNSTNIFTLTVSSSDPQQAYAVLQAVIEYYPEVAEFVVGPTVMHLLDESGVPAQPYNSRQYRQAVQRALLIGAVLWIAVSFVLASLHATVHNEEELKQMLNLHLLGTLPAVRGRKGKPACPRFDEQAAPASFFESVHLLRMRTEKRMQQQNVRVLLISSATPGEGKTTVAVNLAAALASRGRRVALLDCDLRNPSVARGFGLENGTGLTEYLRGEAAYPQIVRPSGVENLSLVLAGRPAADAAELLAGPACKALIGACRRAFDYVILDTPPAALLADASELASLADGALLTVRQGYASRAQVLEGAQALSESRLPILGCVFNYAAGGTALGGYYGYGYGRYGGHYGEKDRT